MASSYSCISTRFRLVLHSPMFPINIGAVARCAANYDVPDFRLVAPRCDIASNENYVQRDAFAFAKGKAREYLLGAQYHATLQDALQGCSGAVAFTARSRNPRDNPNTCIDLDAVTGLACHAGKAGCDIGTSGDNAVDGSDSSGCDGPVALVFGGEDNGLSRDELMLCSHACVLPTATVMPSLNLSHAVAAVLSRLFHDAQAISAASAVASASGPVEGTIKAEQGSSRASMHIGADEGDGGVRDGGRERGLDLIMWSLQKALAPSLNMAQLGGLLQPLRAILSRAAPNTRELRVLHALARHIETLALAEDAQQRHESEQGV